MGFILTCLFEIKDGCAFQDSSSGDKIQNVTDTQQDRQSRERETYRQTDRQAERQTDR